LKTNGREVYAMGRMSENPRYNVISMRISDEERETLQELMNSTHKSVSDIMREAMELFKHQLDSRQQEISKKAA
jgi:predicted DNA-binding protein